MTAGGRNSDFSRLQGDLRTMSGYVIIAAALFVLGVLFTATIFIVEYSAHSGVLLSATLLLERSKVQRSSSETEILEQYGATVLIVHLHGMIFFGSASSVLEEIKAHVVTLAELQLPLQVLLLDFDRCTGIDSSAVAVLFHTRRQIKDAKMPRLSHTTVPHRPSRPRSPC
jgi:SulP family sulfate permease